MNNFFTDTRIRWMLTSFLALICIAGIYVPAVSVGDPLGFSAPEEYSLTWFLKQAAFPEIYSVVLTIYVATLAPMIVFCARKKLSLWPVVVATVGAVFFLAVNLFWGFIILDGGAAAAKLTTWSWIYLALQAVSIVNLIAFALKLRKGSR